VDHPPPAVRFDTRISQVAGRTDRPFCCGAYIRDCGDAGQGEYGGFAALRIKRFFIRAFEIGKTGKSAIVNQP
jgi:hypothetical protein